MVGERIELYLGNFTFPEDLTRPCNHYNTVVRAEQALPPAALSEAPATHARAEGPAETPQKKRRIAAEQVPPATQASAVGHAERCPAETPQKKKRRIAAKPPANQLSIKTFFKLFLIVFSTFIFVNPRSFVLGDLLDGCPLDGCPSDLV